MGKSALLEVVVQTVEHAVAAERGGADRIELCTDIGCGGVTPSPDLIRDTRRNVAIPIHVMIRPRPGDFCYSEKELAIMRQDIAAAVHSGVDGVVLGILRENQRIDKERTRAMVEMARPLPVVFHRAFDLAENLDAALEDVIAAGASRILTAGGNHGAMHNLPTLRRLVGLARGRITLLVGGGVNAANVLEVIRQTSAPEVHSSAGTSSRSASARADGWLDQEDGGNLSAELFQQRVATLVRRMEGSAADQEFRR
jgi:copper homeostasis protein